jgi:capsular polysaccharide biosynthesis protein
MVRQSQKLRRYAALILRWWWLVAIYAVLWAGVAYAHGSQIAPLYTATATLLIQRGDASNEAIGGSEPLALTHSQMLTGRPVMEAASARLGGALAPEALASRIEIGQVPNTGLIRLSVKYVDAVHAAQIANAVAEAYVAYTESVQQSQYADYLGGVRPQMGETDGVVLFERAEVPQAPDNTGKMRDIVLAAAVGAMLAIAIVFRFGYLDDTIKTPDDVQATLGLNTLGVIGRMSDLERDLVVADHPRSVTEHPATERAGDDWRQTRRLQLPRSQEEAPQGGPRQTEPLATERAGDDRRQTRRLQLPRSQEEAPQEGPHQTEPLATERAGDDRRQTRRLQLPRSREDPRAGVHAGDDA